LVIGAVPVLAIVQAAEAVGSVVAVVIAWEIEASQGVPEVEIAGGLVAAQEASVDPARAPAAVEDLRAWAVLEGEEAVAAVVAVVVAAVVAVVVAVVEGGSES
jgi:hypothetical protein